MQVLCPAHPLDEGQTHVEAHGLDQSPQAYEYAARNPDDVAAAREIEHMHAGEFSGGLLDGGDPDAASGLPGITRVKGEASLDAWLTRAASDPRLRERVRPHVHDVLAEAEARGWLRDTGRRRGGLPLYKCTGSGLDLLVPIELLDDGVEGGVPAGVKVV